MSTLQRHIRAHTLVLMLTPLALLAGSATAEKANMPPAMLRWTATDVVVGKVLSISQSTATEGDWRVTHYVAGVKVLATEKGKGLKKGSVFSARYWHRAWAGSLRAYRINTNGYRGLPVKGQTLRIYLARNAYDGFTDSNHDGGYNVIGTNGFEPIPSRPKRKDTLLMSEMSETSGAFWGKLNVSKAHAVPELRLEEAGTGTIHPADVLENAVIHSWTLFGMPMDAESVIFFHERLDLGLAISLDDTTHSALPLSVEFAPQRLAEASEEDLVRDLKEYARRACCHEEQRLSTV